ncbi:acetylcholine receptor subunit beta-like [Octopus vulgaris]|uniref:Acetylcholine receptor subunit beta-like n=2 Tax=Octopus TaxID=6643 RepID=A0AA36BV84_OCTVU|nr:acetylcholine receptor subunit beta-like [Octopus vulgaris]
MQPPVTLYNWVSLTLFVCVLLGLTANLSDGRQNRAYEEITQTLGALFRDYDKNVAPQMHYLQPVMVSLKVTVDHVYSFDPAEQSLHSLLTLETSWSDRRLAWYPTKQRSFRLNNISVWEPSVYFVNALSAVDSAAEPAIRLEYNGNLNKYQKISLKTYCPTEKDQYSFSCPFMLKTYPLPSTQERLRVTDFEVNDNFQSHQWNAEVNTNKTQIYNQDPVVLVIDLELK